MKDAKILARSIVRKHTTFVMTHCESHPESTQELYRDMLEGCASILTEKFLNGELTPMEYNDTSNELYNLLWKVFKKHL